MKNEAVLPSKDELEREKLAQEISLLKSQVETQSQEKKTTRYKNFQNWFSTLTVVCTVVTVGIQSCQYLDQRQKQYEVQVDQQMLELERDLSAADLGQRSRAALMLSAYELNAVPILLSHLRITNDPSPVIESLLLIEQKKRANPCKVAQLLLDGATSLFSNLPQSDITPYKNYIQAIGALGRSKKSEACAILTKLRQKINTSAMTQADALVLRNSISRSCTALTGRDCT